MELALRVARSLEEGRGGLVSRAASGVWGTVATRSLVKHLVFRDDARVIVIGGSTLGGSGKTPLAIACARTLAEAGHRVALVGHAYGARPLVAQVVSPDDDVTRVGDEALLCARELSRYGVAVVVAPTRQAALDLALTQADVAIIDGVAQLHPRRAHLALLAVDASRPWGSGSCPPGGDLRAPREALLALCDRVVSVGSGTDSVGSRANLLPPTPFSLNLTPDLISQHSRAFPQPPGPLLPQGEKGEIAALGDDRHPLSLYGRGGRGVRGAGATQGTRHLPWEELRTHRVGLWTRIARPQRVLEELTTHGVEPVLVVASRDHAPVSTRGAAEVARRGREKGVTLWLCTPKCAVRLPDVLENVPVATVEHDLVLEDELADALRAAAAAR